MSLDSVIVFDEIDRLCGCHACRDARDDNEKRMFRVLVVCSTCGNKRCPHATDHRNACTSSNDIGQPGSLYK